MIDKILLSHGSGGKLSHELVENSLIKLLSNPILDKLDDSAVVTLSGKVAFTTDSYTVNPIFFPGGDIGKLSVCGTVNDLSMVGAIPLFLSLSLLIEEGLLGSDLDKIVCSISKTAKEANVLIVTGDTKVVPRGTCDKIFINTSGIGSVAQNLNISGSNAKIGDKVLLSGSIGDHGISILSKREGFNFSTELVSDCCPLNHLVRKMLEASPMIHCMRDPTRGGLATTLNEIACQSKVGIRIEESKIPIKESVQSACEMLGIDPFYTANEGKLIAIVPEKDAQLVLTTMKQDCYGSESQIIGEIVEGHPGRVVLTTKLRTSRILDMLVGESLPRIC